MPKTDIKLYSTEPSGKATTATISDVNPDATNAQLKTLGQMLNSFTRNRYDKTNRINTIQCDTEEGGGLQTPTLQLLDGSGNPIAGGNRTTDANTLNSVSSIYYDGDGEIIVNAQGTGTLLTNIGSFDQTTHKAPFTFYLRATANQQYSDFTITTTATDTYKAASIDTVRYIAVNA